MLAPKIVAARAIGELARLTGRGGGTSLPGKVLIRMHPHAIESLAGRMPRGCAVVSATNGKTTTAAMTASVLERAGLRLVHNRAGANMAGGVASSLLYAARPSGRIDGEFGLFELDEFWLDRVTPELRPRALLLANLFRDQLDRYGELETIADRWADVVTGLAPASALVLNADDPLVADLGRDYSSPGRGDRLRPGVSYFGVEDPRMAVTQMQHASDSKHCRRCGAAYAYESVYVGHLGRYRCPSCGQERPRPSVAAEQIELDGTRGSRFRLRTPVGISEVSLPLPGLYNVYNALGAAALCLALGIDLEVIVAALGDVRAAFGRAENVIVDGAPLSILLIKNPAGANEIVRTLGLEQGDLDILGVLNDRTADGRDVSWIWDADFEPLAARVRCITCSGTRAAELALRLKYAGVPAERLRIVPDLAAALDHALAAARSRRLFALPTYTALLELRDVLAARGHVQRFWRQAQQVAP